MKFSEFLKDESGKFSSTRLSFLVWALGVFLVWAIVSLKNWALSDMPWEMITIIGLLMTGKVFQLYKEIKD